MANNSNSEEPGNAPEPNRWYNISLGPSLKDQQQSSSKFCLIRYKFKPASIDKNKPGMLLKAKDNRVKVEFENNQHGKPKVAFESVCEDYKDNDAVLFFDGETFQLQRLHRAVKKLKHLRQPSKSTTAVSKAIAPSIGPATEDYSPPGPALPKRAKSESLNKAPLPSLPQFEVERIDTGDFNCREYRKENNTEYPPSHPSQPNTSPNPKHYESEEQVDIVNDDDDNDGLGTAKQENSSEKVSNTGIGFDINLPQQADTDDEIADVDVSDDEEHKVGRNAADTLRAQVNAEGKEQSSNSSSSSGSESSGSGSGSGSSSSDSESDADSLISI